MRPLKIFFATDIHGSETCFMKFVNAGKFYKADILIMGGDITGKMLIPIVPSGSGKYSLQFLGKQMSVTGEQLPSLDKQIRQTGYYPYPSSEEEVAKMKSDPDYVEKVFSHVMYEGLARWLSIAEERLKGTGIRCFITPGNDDQLAIDRALEENDYIINPEGSVVQLGDEYEMASTGYGNITPWNCPRDIPEEELAGKIEVMTTQVKNMETCIFNFHCPPFDSTIDVAPRLDSTLRPVVGPSGTPYMDPVGSTAVREAIEKHQPLLGLHGHIHESRGFAKIGRTQCVNPGSEYSEGYLRGALITLKKGKVASLQLTAG